MFCKSCGKQIDDDSSFCSFCGTKQSETNKPFYVASPDNSNSESKAVNVNLSFGRLPQQNVQAAKVKVEKYDLTYEKESEAMIVGIVLFIISFIFFVAGGVKDLSLYIVLAVFSALGRITLTIWCVNIAKRQNRETVGWGIFAFFLPSLALIIIGQLKKLKRNEVNIILEQQSKINLPNKNPNNLPLVELPAPSALTIDSLKNDNFTLEYMIKEFKRYMKEKNELFPMYAALELNRRGELFSEEIIQSISSYSKEQGFNSIKEMLESYKIRS